MRKKIEKQPSRNDTSITRWLATQKFRELVDNREHDRGALWVIADEDRRPFFEQARAKGYDFRFARKGSKATNGRAA